MNKIKQNKINFILILTTLSVIFSSLTILSLPVLFNYKSKVVKIEKNFYKNFKLYLKTSGNISYKPFPKPHLLVENANINFNQSDKEKLVSTKNLKIFISLRDVYLRSFNKFISTEISNTNFNFKINNIIEFRKHLYQKINKPIIISDSKFFFKNSDNEVILISPIKKITYKIDEKNKNKNFNIQAKIFGIKFKSYWIRNYLAPKISNHNLIFYNPNLEIDNSFEILEDKIFTIKSLMKYGKDKLYYNLLYKNHNLIISSPKTKNINYNIDGNLKLKPFNFEASLKIKNKKINNIIDNLLVNLIFYDESYLGNLSGNLKIIFDDLDNKIINSGEIKFNIDEKKINLINSRFNLNKIGNMETKMRFSENQGDIKFISNNVLFIKDYIEFAKLFQIATNKVKDIKKIYFDIERNIGDRDLTISNIKINNLNSVNNMNTKFVIKNIQNLRASFRQVID